MAARSEQLNLSKLHRERAKAVRRRRLIVERFNAWTARGFFERRSAREMRDELAQLRAEGEKLSSGTLANWLRAYRVDGPAGLLDHRGRGPVSPPREFLAEVMRQRRECPGRPIGTRHLIALAKAEERGWETWTIRETLRYVKLAESAPHPEPAAEAEPEAVKRPTKAVRPTFESN